MAAYTVVFDMPARIAEGIGRGVYEVVGGVVRQVDGKQVVMWLRPALEEGATVAARVGPSLPLLATGAALATLASTATLLVTVGGFVMVARQVSRVEARLDAAMAHLQAIKADVAWLKRIEYRKQRNNLGAALHVADTLEAVGNFDGLAGPLHDVLVAQSFYRQELADLLATPCPLALAPAFAEYANLFVLATGAKARILTLLRGQAEAARQVAADARDYAELHRQFTAPLDDPESGLAQLVQLTDDTEAAMRDSLQILPAPALAEYMPLPGLGRDMALLEELRVVSTPKPGKQAGAVVVGALTLA